MPKDWIGRKAELKQLYINEDKTLLDIQKILSDRGFNASIRAYRMKFHDWKFRKNHYTSKNATCSSNSPPQNSTIVQEDETAAISDVGLESNSKRARHQSRFSPQLSLEQQREDSALIHNKKSLKPFSMVEISQDEPTISIGGFVVPTRPMEPTDLLSIFPPRSGLGVYALLAMWQTGTAYMDCLQAALNDAYWKEPLYPGTYWRDLLCPGDHIQIGDDFVATNMFQVVSKFVPSKDQFKVTKSLLVATTHGFSCLGFLPALTPVTADLINDWENALAVVLIGMPVGTKSDEVMHAAGKVVIAEIILEHHTQLLVLRDRTACLGCSSRNSQEMMREYLDIIKAFHNVESPEFDVEPDFYKYSMHIIDDIEQGIVAKAQEIRQLELQETKQKEDKYRQIIAKYTNLKPENVDQHLDDLLNAETYQILSRQFIPPHAFGAGTSNIGQSFSVATPSHPDSIIGLVGGYSSSKSKPNYDGSQLPPEQVIDFTSLLAGWKSGLDLINHYKTHQASILTLEASTFFEHLVGWVADNVSETDQLPFTRAMVEAYMRLSASPPPAFRLMLHDLVNKMPDWKELKEFLLDKCPPQKLDNLRTWPSLTYPECALRLFGESCLIWLKSHLRAQQLLPASLIDLELNIQCRDNYSAILNDFEAWGFHVDQSLATFLSYYHL